MPRTCQSPESGNRRGSCGRVRKGLSGTGIMRERVAVKGVAVSSRGIDVLDESECKRLLAGQSLGRVGMRYSDHVVVLPVFFGMFEGDVVFRTDPGTKLMAGLMRDRVAFEVDDATAGWSVLVLGHAREVRNVDEQNAILARLSSKWPAGERDHPVRIHPERITGRRLREP